jgi:excisionase family DNA binding protein
MKSEKLLFTKDEAAEIIGVSIHTIARDIRNGRIESRRYGRLRLIPAQELTRIAAEGMKPMDRAAS